MILENPGIGRKKKIKCYSLKSAYIFLQELKNNSRGNGNSDFWRNLWNLKIPQKAKNFIWRATSNCLPSKDLLRVRRVEVNTLCTVCNAEPETTLHSLVSCSFSQACRERSLISNISSMFNSFIKWLQMIFHQKMPRNLV